MAKSLREVLNIPPGTLIKGFKITKTGQVVFSVEGWQFEQRRLVKTLLSPVDRDSFIYTLYQNLRIEQHLSNKQVIIDSDEARNFGVFTRNGRSLDRFDLYSDSKVINTGECVGMSLGENILAVRPSRQMGPYRPDFFDLFVFHKVLNEGMIKWITLQAKQVSKQLIVCNNPSLMDTVLEMV